jgi:CDP-diacylglycerol---serine O-phosphatidyltransferase
LSEVAISPYPGMENGKNNSESEQDKLRIYLLPNLFTGGNLFCGFLAITKIVEADLVAPYPAIKQALFLILLACILDLLDGRVARLGGFESPFGREFDSLADIVSFGVAPAFLVHRVVLRDVFASVPQLGWFIASVYLICGAFRLARFNCLADMPKDKDEKGDKDDNAFLGFPIPAAAGMVASLTLLLMSWDEKDFAQGSWRYILPVILLMLSFMMVSEVEYPSFKKITWKTRHPFRKMVLVILIFGFVLLHWETVLPVVAPLLFTVYLIYGFVRKRISAKMRRDLENAGEE